jgi:two-component system CheB/CheR fusion protein
LAVSETGVGIVDLDPQRRDEVEGVLQHSKLKARSFPSIQSWLENRRSWGGCVLVDYAIAERVDLPARLARYGVDTPIIYIHRTAETADITAAVRSGAFDFVRWPSDQDSLPLRVVRALEANAGRSRIRQRLESVLERLRGLSRRQREVMHLVAQGHPNKIVAFELAISERTVEVHRAEAMKRTGAESLAQMVMMDLAANFFEDGLPWSVDRWAQGVDSMIEQLAPQEEIIEHRRVA